jgi:hypothetical protein
VAKGAVPGRAKSVAVEPGGNVYVVGSVTGTPNTGDTNFKTVKQSGADGSVIWDRVYSSSADTNRSRDIAYWSSSTRMEIR